MIDADVIIIGAGIAGLAAANKLSQQGVDTLILEASDYIGGRIRTDFSFGLPMDLGASWLHGLEGNPVADIVKDLHLQIMPSDFSKVYFLNKSHQLLREEILKEFWENKFWSLIDEASSYAKEKNNDMSLEKAFHQVLARHKEIYDPEIISWALHCLTLYTGANPDKLSAMYATEDKVLPGGNYFLTTSYQPVIDHLSQTCRIELNTIVTKIIDHETTIEIVTPQKSWISKKVIITVSLGVLKNMDIIFYPTLPESKQKAIDSLGMGLLNKFILKFPNVFWPEKYNNLYLSQLGENNIRHFVNCLPYTNMPILMGTAASQEAIHLESSKDAEIIATILQNLSTYFEIPIPEPENFLVTRWNKNSFTRGSYSFIPVNSNREDFDSIAEPVKNNLFFAGEATNRDYVGTVHGAYLSGIREAERLLSAKE